MKNKIEIAANRKLRLSVSYKTLLWFNKIFEKNNLQKDLELKK